MNGQPAIQPVLPGGTIGVLGGGQLGRMMAVAAKQMGYRFHVFTSVDDSPAGQVADQVTLGEFAELDKIDAFATKVDALTIETENIPLPTLDAAGKKTLAYPGQRALQVSQNRGLEKSFCLENDIPTCQFKIIRSVEQLREAVQAILPGVLKTTTGGYDGKGQFVIQSADQVQQAWDELQGRECIFEEWIEYDFEFSVVAARSSTGEVTAYPSIRNEHQNQILDVSISPSGLSEETELKARELTCRILEQLDAVGVLTVEYFCRDGEVLFNEMAPRPHNSGHLTIEGHATSQFEQHIRAVCGLPLGSVEQLRPAAMANLLGDLWQQGLPDWHRAISESGVKLHLYGKKLAKPGRKMGHLTALADSTASVKDAILKARKSLTPPVGLRSTD